MKKTVSSATASGLAMTAWIAFGAAALAQEEERRVVIEKRVHDCPKIEIRGSSGEPVRIGYSNRGFLGVEPTPLTPELRQHFGVAGHPRRRRRDPLGG